MASIAIIADTSLQRHVLQQALASSGYNVVLNSDPARLNEQQLAECATDLWLVDLATSEDSPLVDHLLEHSSCPVLFGEGHAPERHSEHYPRWERSLFSKLKRLLGDPAVAVGPTLEALQQQAQEQTPLALPEPLSQQAVVAGEPAKQVWLLAASMGGPAAVKAFLDALPSGLPIGFLYAQHIAEGFEKALPQAVGRHSQWQVNSARDGDYIRCGEVVVVPVRQELGFNESGQMRLLDQPWPEPYSPSIDQVMLNLAQQFATACGVIVFSGMGSDGSAAAAYVRRQGAALWTQKSDSCACASMPDSLRESGHSQHSGDPQALAEHLVQHLSAQCV